MAYNFSNKAFWTVCFSLVTVSATIHAQTTVPAAKKAAPAPAVKAAEPSKATVAGPSAKSTVDLSKSSVTTTYKQTGVASDGIFRKFNVSLDYDPAKITETKVQVEIDMNSYDLGDESYNTEIRKKEWFNSTQFPKAGFVSSAVKTSGPGKLDVTGKLTLKGKTIDVSMPVTSKQEGSNTVFEGVLPIKRLTFAIGEGEWKDTSVLEDEVRVKFKLTVTAK